MKGGRQALFEVNGDVLRDSESRPIGFVFVCRDLTERKGMELKLMETNSKLKVMTSITRHDIKNQIMALEGYLALMDAKVAGGTRDPCLARAEAAAERISAMIEFTREYENIGVKAPVWQDVSSLVERCLREGRGGNIRYVNDIPKGVEVFADPMLGKVIQNLVQNAERHGGDVTDIRYSLDIVNGVGRLVCKDDGVGISPDQRDTLFSKGTNKEHGFGLFLSKEILGMTGITVSEEGDSGHGAKFVMTIPTEGIRRTV
jgi:signal transduction histidine kinase